MPKIKQSQLRQEDKLVLRNNSNNEVQNVIFPNGLQVGLASKEFNHGVKLSNLDTAPSQITNLLYAVDGKIYFNGNLLEAAAGWTDDGTVVRLTTVTDRVGIGTAGPDCMLHVAGAAAFSGPSETFVTFGSSDTTPTVATGNLFKTHASSQTLTMFDGGVAGQIINVISTAAVVYDVTSTNLKGGTTNITTANGDVTTWIFDGTNWYLINFMDQSADLSGGH